MCRRKKGKGRWKKEEGKQAKRNESDVKIIHQRKEERKRRMAAAWRAKKDSPLKAASKISRNNISIENNRNNRISAIRSHHNEKEKERKKGHGGVFCWKKYYGDIVKYYRKEKLEDIAIIRRRKEKATSRKTRYEKAQACSRKRRGMKRKAGVKNNRHRACRRRKEEWRRYNGSRIENENGIASNEK